MAAALIEKKRECEEVGTPLTLEQLLSAWHSAKASVTSSSGGGKRAWARYNTACIDLKAEPQPVTVEKIYGFILYECLRGIKSHTLGAAVGSLLAYVSLPELDIDVGDVAAPAARRAIAGAVRSAAVEFPSEVERVLPIDDAVMLQVHAYLLPFLEDDNIWALQMWSIMTLAYATGLRSVNYLGRRLTPSQLRVVELKDGRSTSQWDVPYRKTKRSTRDREKDTVVAPRRPDTLEEQKLDHFRALQRYLSAVGIKPGKGAQSIFPGRFKNGNLRDYIYEAYDYGWFLDDLRWLLQKAGVRDNERYGSHSFRRGCATRLLGMGAAPSLVMKLCGWAAEESMRIYDARMLEVAEQVGDLELARQAGPARNR